jgi:hypothetical protein
MPITSSNPLTSRLKDILQVSTLPNGIRVATESTPGHFASVGIYVNAGSRYEHSKTMGASHLLDRMSYCVSPIDPCIYNAHSSVTDARPARIEQRSSLRKRSLLWAVNLAALQVEKP